MNGRQCELVLNLQHSSTCADEYSIAVLSWQMVVHHSDGSPSHPFVGWVEVGPLGT